MLCYRPAPRTSDLIGGMSRASSPVLQGVNDRFLINSFSVSGSLNVPFTSRRWNVFDYIERLCNPRRRHSSIGYVSPVESENSVALPQVGVDKSRGSSPARLTTSTDF